MSTQAQDDHRHFRAFGLIFGSREPLPGWPEETPKGNPDVDVVLRLRQCPQIGPEWGPQDRADAEVVRQGIEDEDVEWRDLVTSPHFDTRGEPLVRVQEWRGFRRFLYHDGATFHVDDRGHRAWLDWPEASSLDAIWLYFCGPVLTWILRLHGRVVLHAAASKTRSGALLLAGPSGAGKSTTAAGLALVGCPLISDDTAALTRPHAGSGGAVVWPDSPRLRLWPESGPAISEFDVKALPPLCEGWDKRAFDTPTFEKEPSDVAAIYCLRPGDEVGFLPVPAARALPLLIAHASAAELADREMRRREFELLSDLAERVLVIEASRPDGLDLAPALLEDFEERFAAKGSAASIGPASERAELVDV